MKKSADRWYIRPEVVIVDFEASEDLLPLSEPVLQAGQWKQGVFIPY